MAKATLVVLTNPVSDEVEDEYNDWYDNTHLQDVVGVDGFVSAQRFKVVDVAAMEGMPAPSHRYLALYEVETDDINAVAEALTKQATSGEMFISPALDATTATTFWVEPVGAPVLGA